MITFRKLIAALTALIICLSLGAAAWAAETGKDELSSAENAGEEVSLAVAAEKSYEGMSWEEIVSDLLAEYNATPESVHAGYCNLVTGEEHYLNGDDYMVAGSMYKLPLCMYFTELLKNGEFDWTPYEGSYVYKDIQDEVLINSSNDQAMFLWGLLGGYYQFRKLTVDYMGCTEEELTLGILDDNKYTSRQFIHCLKLLYDEQERFPEIIETMQKGEPERFFRLREPRFNIAHKYGYFSNSNGRSNMNDCGLAFTSQPIALVMFTQNLMDPEGLLTDYCTAMCDYTERMAAPPEETPEPAPEAAPEPAAAPEITAAPEAAEERSFPLFALAAVALFLVLALVGLIVFRKRYRRGAFWMLLAILVTAITLLLAVLGLRIGTVYAAPDGDPADTAAAFLDAICSGDYPTAYTMLNDYADLGLGSVPETEAGAKAYAALHRSFSYEFSGECSTEQMSAAQPVRFTYLDLTALEDAVTLETAEQLKRIVHIHSVSEVYDENKNFRPEIANEAYLAALDVVLASAEDYCTDMDFTLSLTYSEGEWKVLTGPALLKALSGGTGA